MSKNLHFLLLEDSTQDAEAVADALRKAGFTFSFQHARGEQEFIQALEKKLPDVVLADYTLPGFDGMQALVLLRKDHPDIPFICVSGAIGEEKLVELLKQGALDFVSKQRLSQLGPAIQRALREVAQRAGQKQAEAALRHSESRFRAVFEGAGTGIIVEDLEGKIIDTNRSLQEMLGYSAAELQQITRKDFTHARDHKEETHHFRRLLSGETASYQAEKRFVRKDGRIIWGRLTVTIIRDVTGQPQFPIAMIEDITARQRAEDALVQYAAIIESTHDAIISMTFDGIIFSWNPGAERLYGYTAGEANGRSLSIITPPDKEEEVAKILERMRSGERVDNYESVRLRKDGSRLHVSVTASPIKDAAGKTIGASSISRDITQRKEAEEALRKSEARLAKAQQIARLGSWERDLQTNTLIWSDETCRIFGIEPGQFEGTYKDFLDRVHPDDLALVRTAAKEALEFGRPYAVDHRIVLPNGEIRTVNEQAETVLDADGKPIRYLGTVLDITQRKKAEVRIAALSNLGQRLSSASTSRHAAGIIADVADKLFGWDACSLDLCSAEEAVFNSILNMDLVNGRRTDLSNARLKTEVSPLMCQVMEQGAELILRPESMIAAEAGQGGEISRQAMSLMYVPVHNGPEAIGVLSIQSYSFDAYTEDDLHTLQALADHCGGALERIRTEAENQKLAAFPQVNPNPVLELAADGSLNYFNDAALQMAKSLGKKQPAEILPPNTGSMVHECLATGRSRSRLETVIEGRTISWSFFPVREIGVVHCYAGDVTERQNLEAQLRQSQKMESVGQLAGGIAHDFNNILTVIQGHTSLLGMAGGLSESAQESAQQIGLAAERAANLTRQLLTFSRRQIMQPKNLDLNEVVNNMSKMLRRLLGEDVTLQVNYTAGLPLVQADPGMMEQILLNLSVNARDAMPKGGRLFIHTSAVTVDEAYVQHNHEAHPGDYVCLTVRDTGVGISAENLRHIFEPFFTTKDVGKGTGLGLATVYGIVQQHRGWINVASTLGKETKFEIFLPATAAKAEAVETPAPAAKVRGGRETILVVEDETPLRILVRNVLERYGYKVVDAASGVSALPVWEEFKGQISLLLTDMVMPHGMSGRELAAKLRCENPKLKVIYSSGYSLAVVGSDMVLQEGLNFLQKPYHPRKLAQAVRDCLDDKHH
ncbi:MAG: multi-sensor hybrid histidine kinase [Pedosphaera sp.]|nr:multi-sensor hybrid histidine kinase [Pedosphaera sp.]